MSARQILAFGVTALLGGIFLYGGIGDMMRSDLPPEAEVLLGLRNEDIDPRVMGILSLAINIVGVMFTTVGVIVYANAWSAIVRGHFIARLTLLLAGLMAGILFLFFMFIKGYHVPQTMALGVGWAVCGVLVFLLTRPSKTSSP